MICIVPCGMIKAATAAPARDLYVGKYFRANLGYALSLVGPDATFILSAKHGFMRLDQIIAPYELRFGMPGTVTRATLQTQIKALGLDDQIALIQGGAEYSLRAHGLFVRQYWLMDLMRGELSDPCSGAQAAWLRRNLGIWPLAIASLASDPKNPRRPGGDPERRGGAMGWPDQPASAGAARRS